VEATEPLVYVGVSVLLAAVAAEANWVPARPAAALDPMTVLRGEWARGRRDGCGEARLIVLVDRMHDITHASPPASGRFVLRISPGLHAALREAARDAGLSLNDYCARKLALPTGSVTGPAADIVARASAGFGKALVGIVAFGSWARGEAADDSDLDILVIVEPTVAIVRDLYRVWDEEPLSWDGLPVEVHFVHLPEPPASPSGLWAEAALHGVVLFERDLAVSRRLAQLRGRIVEGGLARRRTHGQPYWVGGS